MANDFTNIVELTRALDAQKAGLIKEFEAKNYSHERVWNLEIQLVIAQQLSVISGHLGVIANGIKEESKKPK